MRTAVGVVVVVAAAAVLHGQTPEAPRSFEVTSVKRNYLPPLMQRADRRSSPGRFTATNSTLRSLAKYAFDVVIDAQLIGGPDWIDSARFNIEATAPAATLQEIRPMVRRLLEQRFGLVVRKQTRTLQVYRLVGARNDGKLPKGLTPSECPETAPANCGLVGGGPSSLMGVGATMDRLARTISQLSEYTEVDRLVIDNTGLTATYQFSLQFSPTREHYGLRSERDPNQPSFTSALQEQLGLKLQPASAPVDVWVIESAKWPESN